MTEHLLHFNRKRNYQRIAKDKVVRLKYLLRDRDTGQTLDYRDDMVYLHGGYGSAFPKIEQALEGLEVDMKAEVDLDPHEGYGAIDPQRQLRVPVDAIPEQARQVGAQLDGEDPDGTTLNYRVTAVDDDHLILDANHPMAGRRLHFLFEVLDIRDAHPREIAAGYGFAEAPGPDA
jgi:FKBP-type peptidyl-prolyl cis-trans isomerase SlyD